MLIGMAPSPRFDRTSAAILDAAARVFYEEGASANLASVAAAAGISRATLYRYYANREALLEALSADAIEAAVRRLADAGLERASVDDAIGRLVRAMLAVGDRYAMVADHQSMLKAANERLASVLRDVLRRGVDAGDLRTDLAVDVLYEFLAATILTALKLTQKHGLGLEEASAAAAAMFLDGARRR